MAFYRGSIYFTELDIRLRPSSKDFGQVWSSRHSKRETGLRFARPGQECGNKMKL